MSYELELASIKRLTFKLREKESSGAYNQDFEEMLTEKHKDGREYIDLPFLICRLE